MGARSTNQVESDGLYQNDHPGLQRRASMSACHANQPGHHHRRSTRPAASLSMPARQRLPGRARRHHPRWDRLRVRIPELVGDRQPERRPRRLPQLPGRHPLSEVRAGLASRLCQGMWSCAVPARDSEADRDTSPGRAHQRPASRRQPGKARPNHQGDHHTPVPQERHHDGAGQRLLALGDAAGRRAAPPARGSRRPRQAPGPAAVPPGRPLSTAGRTLVKTARPQAPHGYRAHRAPAGHEALGTTEQPQTRPLRHSHRNQTI